MKIEIENIGPIKKAEVEIGGLTVIAGRNSTGKSTIGKLIYVAINSFIKDENGLKKLQQAYLKNDFFQRMFKVDFPEIKDPLNITANEIDECLKKQPDSSAMQLLKTIFNTSKDNYIHIFTINYASNLGSFFTDNYIRFDNKYNMFTIASKDKIKTSIILELLPIDNTNKLQEKVKSVTYNPECTEGLTDVYILNDEQVFITNTLKVTVNNIVPVNIIDDLLIEIEQIIGGTIKSENSTIKFIENGHSLDVTKIADGIQQFAKLFQFIKVNQSTSSTLLVFDEPEIHLHPAWQLKMAEVLVLVAKRLYVPLLINTHSDIMLKGLKEYSKKHGYTHTKFYHAKKDDDGNGCVINNVDMDDIDIITEDLASPYYNIIDLRMENS